MPSKKQLRELSSKKKDEFRPFTVFFVDPDSPEEVQTDTIMAMDYEDAKHTATEKHPSKSILHVRGIGDRVRNDKNHKSLYINESNNDKFPGARFIKGEFLPTTFSDENILETLSDSCEVTML